MANENNISVKTVLRHTNGFKKVNGRVVAKRWDRIPRVMRINTDGKERSVEIGDSRTHQLLDDTTMQ